MTRKSKRRLIAVLAVVSVLVALFFLGRPPAVPKAAIESSVQRDDALMARAWELPVAKTFRPNLLSQSNPSFCGPASVANVFRSLGEPAMTEKAVLDGTGRCWTGLCIPGLTLDQLGEVARAHTQRKVTVLRDLTADDFREHLKKTNDPSRRYIINFSRKPIFGGGTGHHSPIAGYLEAEDLVFVLDVNADYRPWLIERDRLYRAMDTLDGERKRGLLLVE